MNAEQQSKRQSDLIMYIKSLARNIESAVQLLQTQDTPKSGTVSRLWNDAVTLRDVFERYQEYRHFR